MTKIKSGSIVSIPLLDKKEGAFPNESYIRAVADGTEISGFIDNDFIEDKGKAMVGVVLGLENDKILIRFNGELNRSKTVVSSKWLKENCKELELK